MTESTILFADIAGSTALYESIGDTQAELIISSTLDALSSIVRNQQGLVIKTIGDEIMCRFTSADKAIQAASEMHEFTEAGNIPGSSQKLAIRIGAHMGSVIDTDGDVFGDTVNVSARIAAQARPGKTMISEQTYQSLPESQQILCRLMMQTHLKGKEQPVNLYDVVWEKNDQLTRISQTPRSLDGQGNLIIKYQQKKMILPFGTLSIGRGQECNLVVEATQASRRHCEIRLKGNKFILVDSSTNGTFVTQNNVEYLFHNETVPLQSNGVIGLGQSSKDDPDHIIQFSVEIKMADDS